MGGTIVPSRTLEINSSGIVEKTRSIDESTGVGGNTLVATERVDGIRKSIDGIGVVEGLGTKSSEKGFATLQGRAVVNVLVRLDNPDKLLNGVVEVELDLVTGGSDRLVTSELELLNEVLVGVLCHSAALIGVKEDIVNIEGSSNEGLVVGSGNLGGTSAGTKGLDGP